MLLLTIVAIGALAQTAFPTDERFPYSNGQLTSASTGANVSGGKWVNISGTGNFIQVAAETLRYSNYPLSGTGKIVQLTSTLSSAEDAVMDFPRRTSGELYASFMISVVDTGRLPSNTSVDGEYFAALVRGTTNFWSRLAVRKGPAAGFQLGIRGSSVTAGTVWDATERQVGTAYLVTIGYKFFPSTTDSSYLWINTPFNGTPPRANVVSATVGSSGASDADTLYRFLLRQGSTSASGTSTPAVKIGGIRVDTTGRSQGVPTSIAEWDPTLRYELDQNYPNPFNPSTMIRFTTPISGPVSLKVYSLLGQEIQTLFSGDMPAGRHSVRFDGSGLASGMYFYHVQAGEYKSMRRMILLK